MANSFSSFSGFLRKVIRYPKHFLPCHSTRKVDFLICGTQKGGTSALDTYLREHPEVCMADRKEVHFFDNDSRFTGGEPNYFRYHAYFSPRSSHKILGEATPVYMYWRDAPARIHAYNPSMKLIVLLRNPIERAYSHWNMERARRRDPLAFWEALQNEKERCARSLPHQNHFFSYMDRGFYTIQLQRLWQFFPKEQVLILKSEDLRQKPQDILERVCDFLGVSSLPNPAPRSIHSIRYAAPMTEREREYLRKVFEQEIRELEQLLGWDCSNWLST
ncbi:MAG: sulfotransferase domain-containing protein [Candidatus Sumerlaeaceae bacterium]|nr:sulfotransferase domain-containing protein [Candidatus Sumerlaeaceae bacterium]